MATATNFALTAPVYDISRDGQPVAEVCNKTERADLKLSFPIQLGETSALFSLIFIGDTLALVHQLNSSSGVKYFHFQTRNKVKGATIHSADSKMVGVLGAAGANPHLTISANPKFRNSKIALPKKTTLPVEFKANPLKTIIGPIASESRNFDPQYQIQEDPNSENSAQIAQEGVVISQGEREIRVEKLESGALLIELDYVSIVRRANSVEVYLKADESWWCGFKVSESAQEKVDIHNSSGYYAASIQANKTGLSVIGSDLRMMILS